MLFLLKIIFILINISGYLCFFDNIVNFLGDIKDTIHYNSVSLVSEQCDDRWIPADIEGLEEDLFRNLFGQPLVSDVVVNALGSHFNKDRTHRRKPLVLSFHGWPGGGKTFVARMILKHIFKKGTASRFAKMYLAKTHFPRKSEVEQYKVELQNAIRSTVASCPQSIFIFDEVDKYPPGLLDVVKPYLDYHEHVDGYDYRNAVFIFLTNNGARDITHISLQLWQEGKNRDNYKLRTFEKVIKDVTFNDEGGFYRSDLILSHLIDHYIPFLPLEKEHVTKCISVALMHLQGHILVDHDSVVFEVMEEITFRPEGIELYAVSGCKIVTEKVQMIVERELRQRRKLISQKSKLEEL